MKKKEKIVTYTPSPLDTSDITLPPEIMELAEKLAENTHEVWSQGRINEGWEYGEKRNDRKKKHPDLIPYGQLPDSEKAYDRNTAVETLKLIIKLGFKIEK